MLAATAQAVEVIGPSEVEPGTPGICITEMDGGEVVEIPLTVIGTVGPWTPEGEMVLVRLEDERFRHTGIIAGMSGSPVYVDGRLLGALAFGWSFAKEPIGGVTPFVRMETLADDQEAPGNAASGRPPLVSMMEARENAALGDLLTGWLLPETGSEARGLPVAVTASGAWSPTGGDWLAESWRRLGWVSVPGGSTDGPVEGELRPGGMIAGVMVDGDAVLAAGGTVTEVRGDEVWAFGHPFLGFGGFRLPMARAHVVAVMPSQASSFKFFSVGESIGSFVSDRSRGIWGRLGEETRMVPITVRVDGRRFDFRSVRHASLTPFLVAYVAQSSQASRGRLFGDQTITARIELTYDGHEPVVYEEVLASGEAPAQLAAIAAALTAYLENSVFDVPELESVVIDLATEERLRGARLVDVIPQRKTVRPGELLPVRLRFQPYRGEEFTRELAIEVPSGLPDGRLDLVVADGASWSLYDLGMRPLRPGSFGDEVRLINSLLPTTSMVMAFERQQSGVALPGGSMAMPPSLVVQLSGGLGPGLETTSYSVVGKIVERTETPVSGAERIELQVRAERPLGRPEVR
ncbi:MAG: SpoIVB peptidase S55 domain-containing protein [Candidatus Sulfomarinibacteraceae bacterium]